MKAFAWLALIILWTSSLLSVEKVAFQRGYKAGQFQSLPTQSEVQEILRVGVDGVIGSESRTAWDKVIEQRVCDEYAMPYMIEFNKQFDKQCLNNMKFD